MANQEKALQEHLKPAREARRRHLQGITSWNPGFHYGFGSFYSSEHFLRLDESTVQLHAICPDKRINSPGKWIDCSQGALNKI